MTSALSNFRHRLLSQSRTRKQCLVMAFDAAACLLAVWAAFSLRLDAPLLPQGVQVTALLLAPALLYAAFWPLGVYRSVFRHTGLAGMRTIATGVLFFTTGLAALFAWRGAQGPAGSLPRSVPVIAGFILLGLLAVSRGIVRGWLGYNAGTRGSAAAADTRRVIIYGAGSSGVQTARSMTGSREFRVVAFIDDAPALQGRSVNGVRVWPPEKLAELIERAEATDIVLAMPSVSRLRRNAILERLRPLPAHILTLPALGDIANGRVKLSDVRELDIEDLLGRDPVAPRAELMRRNVRGKTVLVTGAGGSIGSELCRQILRVRPVKLLLVESSEFALYAIEAELQVLRKANPKLHEVAIIPLLASVRDAQRMHKLFAAWRPDTVYHAAAYKHVPLVEHNPAEGIANNVFGTLQTARLAAEHGVADFVLISTDKAVRPTNIMGASKRLAEMALQALAGSGGAARHGTRFTMVRFGNVLGSSGSVVPRFRQQIREGGPITLTHADITRYFMTIPEAAQLVIQAGAMGQGGDVFVLDMGQPVRIIDLARRMVELSGLTVRDAANEEGDIEITVTGLRPGEKLYEELLIGDDPQGTDHPRIMKAREDFLPWAQLEPLLQRMQRAVEANDVPAMRSLLQEAVVGYRPTAVVVDLLHVEQVQSGFGPDAQAARLPRPAERPRLVSG